MSDPERTPPELVGSVAHIGVLVKGVLAELADKNQDFAGLGLPVVIYGPGDDGADAAPPSVSWMPLNETWTPPRVQGKPGQPGALFSRGVPVSFQLFGGVMPEGTYTAEEAKYHDPDLTEILLSKLVNCLQRQFAQPVYGIESATWFSPGRTGIGMAFELVVSFKVPLVREDNPTIKATHVKANAEFADHG